MPESMSALLLDEPGEPAGLRLGRVAVPEPGRGEIRVRVEACGLNPVDVHLVRGGHPAWNWPHVPGIDVVGVVDAVGEGVDRVLTGDRVAYHGDLRRPGGLADYAVTDASAVAVVPAGVDPGAAAALPCAGMTAYLAVVRRLRVTEDYTLLVTAAAGGVGGFSVQLAAAAGARVIATASAANADHVKRLGAHEVIDYRTEDVAARVRELTRGRGVDGVVDTLDRESATANLGLLAYGGGLAAVGARPDLDAVPAFTIAPSVHEIALGAAYGHADPRPRTDLSVMLGTLLGLVDARRLDPMVSRVLSLDEVPDALTALAGRHVRGKLVYRAR
ncbi:zinc-binding dehydrogenase [Brooklawnia cerclae]|uniref:NADPH:quinone reductase-like Zn-dependent oxidoreductase n=1 Tax=Brooklawnia cerclae TaxID=349934 RepID=A0ABX0SM23_9ACTN|nr:zinc-binding dehydrogenase [Brooklawnia cerclae]NIH57806.1 NADPH:quinone reductase-like Zn-dependent oxidoreductase [Brooklawnia cerclae]